MCVFLEFICYIHLIILSFQKEIVLKLTEVLEDLYGPVTKVCDSGSRTEAIELLNGSADSSDLKGGFS